MHASEKVELKRTVFDAMEKLKPSNDNQKSSRIVSEPSRTGLSNNKVNKSTRVTNTLFEKHKLHAQEIDTKSPIEENDRYAPESVPQVPSEVVECQNTLSSTVLKESLEEKDKQFRRHMMSVSSSKRGIKNDAFLIVGSNLLINAVQSGININNLYCGELASQTELNNIIREIQAYKNDTENQ